MHRRAAACCCRDEGNPCGEWGEAFPDLAVVVGPYNESGEEKCTGGIGEDHPGCLEIYTIHSSLSFTGATIEMSTPASIYDQGWYSNDWWKYDANQVKGVCGDCCTDCYAVGGIGCGGFGNPGTVFCSAYVAEQDCPGLSNYCGGGPYGVAGPCSLGAQNPSHDEWFVYKSKKSWQFGNFGQVNHGTREEQACCGGIGSIAQLSFMPSDGTIYLSALEGRLGCHNLTGGEGSGNTGRYYSLEFLVYASAHHSSGVYYCGCCRNSACGAPWPNQDCEECADGVNNSYYPDCTWPPYGPGGTVGCLEDPSSNCRASPCHNDGGNWDGCDHNKYEGNGLEHCHCVRNCTGQSVGHCRCGGTSPERWAIDGNHDTHVCGNCDSDPEDPNPCENMLCCNSQSGYPVYFQQPYFAMGINSNVPFCGNGGLIPTCVDCSPQEYFSMYGLDDLCYIGPRRSTVSVYSS